MPNPHSSFSRVTHIDLNSCLNSSAYMCFYVKRHFEYKARVVPTYVKRREDEVIREREMELEKEAARLKELEAEKEARMKEVDEDILSMI